MKSYVCTDAKPVDASILRNLPSFGNSWYHLQIRIELHQAVEKHVHRPAAGLVAGKGGIERCDATFLVVAKNLFVLEAFWGLTSLYYEDGG